MRSIPTITKNLLIINVLAFLAAFVLKDRGIDLNDIFGLHFFLADDFRLYQLVTYLFMHGGWGHLFFNMFALWMFGCVVENTWGPKKFLFYYIACGLGAGLIQEVTQYFSYLYLGLGGADGYTLINTGSAIISKEQFLNLWTTVGASGAIYGILLAFGMLYPNERIFIFPIPVPVKAKWFVVFYAALELFSAMSTSNDNVAHFAHLGGMLFGFLIIRYWRRHPYGYATYGSGGGKQMFDRLKDLFKSSSKGGFKYHRNTHFDDAGQQSAPRDKQKEAEKQKEVDRILDKIRKSGYDSLTDEEKKTLFDSSK